ncbi:MAG TPA: hypothetical protein VFI18_10890 [Gaiellales bacterium]|nr:hypothetical protein [Gaiellales bacterium]
MSARCWRDGPWRYVVSLHSWRPRAETLLVLSALVAGLKPVP